MQKKLSVIIPVYNTGIFVEKCVQSVLNQTEKSVEIIIVDDGSNKETAQICDILAKTDDRIIVIHKENAGVSAARNTGINASQGEYLGFVDSDDLILENMYENMLSYAKTYGCDIVMSDTTTIYYNGTEEPDTIPCVEESGKINTSQIQPMQLLSMAGSACRCIYKAALIKKNNISFPVGQKLSEDRIFNIYAMGAANAIYYDKTSYYKRYVIKSSAVNKYYENALDILLCAREKMIEAAKTAWKSNLKIEKAYSEKAAYDVLGAVYNEFHCDSKKTFLQKYKAISDIVNDERTVKILTQSQVTDFKIKLIKKKRTILLCILSALYNMKKS